MKKFTLILSGYLLTFAVLQGQNLSSLFKGNSLKGETSGKISFYSPDDPNKFIVVGNDTVAISPKSKLNVDLTTKKRIHVFYKQDVNGKNKTATLVDQEDFLTPEFKFYLPIPTWIWGTAINTIESTATYKKDYGNVTMWGVGVGAQAHVYPGVRILMDINGFTYKQEVVAPGGTTTHYIDIGGQITFPSGAKYDTYTTSIRLGAKYTFLREKMFQPWVGIAYGVNVWNVKYVTWDESKIYGSASGVTLRSSIMFGVDLKVDKMGTVSFFFDAISPVANYTMKNLFGIGDYSQFDGVTYPTPRIGLAIGM